jgi:hypothetical protein
VRPIWATRGDTFFSHSDSILGGLIRWAETDPGESMAWTNHCGVVVESGWMVPPAEAQDLEYPALAVRLAVVVEALSTVKRQAWWTAHRDAVADGQEVRVFRPVPAYTYMEALHFAEVAQGYVGDKYGWWKLALQLADRALFKGRKVLSNLCFIDSRPICSYLAAHVNDAARPIGTPTAAPLWPVRPWPGFGMNPDGADPDSMLRYCLAHPDEWQEVR